MLPFSKKRAGLKARLVFPFAIFLLLLFMAMRFHHSLPKKIHSYVYSTARTMALKEGNIGDYNTISMNKTAIIGKEVDVLIVGQARSGTTFLGELFNQHPHFAYIFEPLWAVTVVLQHNIFYDISCTISLLCTVSVWNVS